MKLYLMVIAFAIVQTQAASPDTAREAHFVAATLGKESECKALHNPTIAGQCLEAVRAFRLFRITAEEYNQVMSRPTEPAKINQSKAEESLESIAGSLRFMAVVSGAAFAISVVAFIFSVK